MRRLRKIRKKYESRLLKKANVVGVGIGYRDEDEPDEDELALVVNVTHKVPLSQLRKEDRIPSCLDGMPVRVEAIGIPRAEEDDDD